MNITKKIEKIEAWNELSSFILANYKNKHIFLKGQLGAGKTSFVKAYCSALGISDEVSSPTYSLVQEYGAETKVFHLDLYRLENIDQLLEIGIEEYLYANQVCCIEWPDLVIDYFPDIDYLLLEISVDNDGIRQVTLSNSSGESRH